MSPVTSKRRAVSSTVDPTTDVAGMAARLRLSATRLARRLRQEAGTGLSPSQLSALATVFRHGPLPLGELAERERVAPPTVTRVVAHLEGEGLVGREVDAADRRVTRVAVTSAGSALIEASRRRKTAWLVDRLDQLEPGDRDRLAAALDVLDTLTTEERL